MTYWDFVLFVVLHSKTNEGISDLTVMYRDPENKIVILKQDNNFEEKLKVANKYEQIQFQFKWNGDWCTFSVGDLLNLEQEYKKFSGFFSEKIGEKDIKNALHSLFENNDENYCKNLVSCKEAQIAKFSEDSRKAAAIVVTGESGSGKTSFAKQYLRRVLKDASFIYKEIGEKETNLYLEPQYLETRYERESDQGWRTFQAQLKETMMAMRECAFDEFNIP